MIFGSKALKAFDKKPAIKTEACAFFPPRINEVHPSNLKRHLNTGTHNMHITMCLCCFTALVNFCDEKPAATVPNAAPASEQFDRSMSAQVLLACARGFKASGAMSSSCSCGSEEDTGVWITSQPSACIGASAH